VTGDELPEITVVCPTDGCRDPAHRGLPGVIHTPRGMGPNRLSNLQAETAYWKAQGLL
jgi:hypothetical protein